MTISEERLREMLAEAATAMEKARDWIEAEYSETDLVLNGALSEIDANLHVTAYDIRAALSLRSGAHTNGEVEEEAANVECLSLTVGDFRKALRALTPGVSDAE
jgi:hypothetical protein